MAHKVWTRMMDGSYLNEALDLRIEYTTVVSKRDCMKLKNTWELRATDKNWHMGYFKTMRAARLHVERIIDSLVITLKKLLVIRSWLDYRAAQRTAKKAAITAWIEKNRARKSFTPEQEALMLTIHKYPRGITFSCIFSSFSTRIPAYGINREGGVRCLNFSYPDLFKLLETKWITLCEDDFEVMRAERVKF